MTGFLIRWAAALCLVLLTYNPSEINFVRWAMSSFDSSLSLIVLAGLLLVTGYIIFLRATLRSIGPYGIALIAALVGALLWVMADNGLLDTGNTSLMIWLGLIALSLILAIGLSWSLVRRRLSGQADVDDVDE